MKILIATGIYPPDIGGPATYTKLLADELPQYGVLIHVLSFGSVRRFPPGIRHMFYLFQLLRHGTGADLIYAQDTVSVGVPAAVAAFLLRKPLWVRVPGHHEWEQAVQRFGVTATLDEYLKQASSSFLLRLMRFCMKAVLSGAEQIIVPSRYLKGVVMKMGNPEQKIAVIYSSVNVPHVTKSKQELKTERGLSGRVIVSAGRLVPWKGFEALITAFSRLHAAVPDTRLVIAGEGPLRPRLEQQVRALGCAEEVVFTGRLPQSELFAYLTAADVFVLNTAYEGLSHQLIEVMLLKTPIITTPVGGNPELIQDGVEGVFVPYNDAEAFAESMQRVLEDEAYREHLVTAAHERGLIFTSGQSVPQLLELLKQHGYRT